LDAQQQRNPDTTASSLAAGGWGCIDEFIPQQLQQQEEKDEAAEQTAAWGLSHTVALSVDLPATN
jgi:hypothetical protein